MVANLFKKWGLVFLKEVSLHIVACGILSFLAPDRILFIWLIGLIIPDFPVLIIKVLVDLEKLQKRQYFYLKKASYVLHAIILAISIVAIFRGYTYVGIAGISHMIIDLLGF